MSYPSDYRHNPFKNVSTAVTLTERHLIPTTSPYHIRLNEVPKKTAPSTMSCKIINSINGSTISYGTTMTEVAATPGANQFRPDYSTGADGDQNWNTGTIEFNAGNAGSMVEISYTGTGALASLNTNHCPSWMTDLGDGSDGDFYPTTNVELSGVKNYKSVYIPEGVTVKVNKYLVIKCQGMFVNKGTLSADGAAGNGGNNTDLNGGDGLVSYGGAGVEHSSKASGRGGARLLLNPKESLINAGDIITLLDINPFGGSGGGKGHDSSKDPKGGAGGHGGGLIIIECNGLNNSGAITARGNNGNNGIANGYYPSGSGGGGGGGAIVIIGPLYARGTIEANGGAGGSVNGEQAAAGGNGLIILR